MTDPCRYAILGSNVAASAIGVGSAVAEPWRTPTGPSVTYDAGRPTRSIVAVCPV